MERRPGGVCTESIASATSGATKILPKLQSLPVRVIAEAMGCSGSHGSKVRSGLLVPHKRHWKVLLTAVRAK
jgi:hypothetical protein